MKKIDSKHFFQKFKEYLIITCAGILNAISLFTFVNPAKLVASGFSGLSSALSYVFAGILGLDFDTTMSIIYFTINVPLLIVALILLRGDFTFKTIWATVVCSLTLKFLPSQFKFHNAPNARLLSIIFGGIIIGIAMYLASEYNGSNGGTEIVGRLVAKYHPERDLSKVIMVVSFFITTAGSIVIMVVEHENLGVILYSITYVVISSTVMGILKRGFNHPQKFLIITSKWEEISADINNYFQRGFSHMEIENRYDGKEKKMISVIVQYRQKNVLKQIVRRHDPDAFTIVKDVHDVFSRPTFNRSYKTK